MDEKVEWSKALNVPQKNPLSRLSPNSAIVTLDNKVLDLKKRLNKLRYKSQRKVKKRSVYLVSP